MQIQTLKRLLEKHGVKAEDVLTELFRINPDLIVNIILDVFEHGNPQLTIDGLLKNGRLIEAIKTHRAHFNSRLKDAKEACEARRELLKSQGKM